MNVIQSLLPWLASIAGGGSILAFLTKSFKWPRVFESMVVIGPRGDLLREKNGDIKEFTGFHFFPAGFFKTATVNMKDRFDNIDLGGIMRLAEDEDGERHREKWELTGTIESHVTKGHVFEACEWHVTDLGEHIRGTAQNEILTYLQGKIVTLNLESSNEIFKECEEKARKDMMIHGVTWTRLMINKHSLADAEIQGKATRRIAKAIEHAAKAVIEAIVNFVRH